MRRCKMQRIKTYYGSGDKSPEKQGNTPFWLEARDIYNSQMLASLFITKIKYLLLLMLNEVFTYPCGSTPLTALACQ